MPDSIEPVPMTLADLLGCLDDLATLRVRDMEFQTEALYAGSKLTITRESAWTRWRYEGPLRLTFQEIGRVVAHANEGALAQEVQRRHGWRVKFRGARRPALPPGVASDNVVVEAVIEFDVQNFVFCINKQTGKNELHCGDYDLKLEDVDLIGLRDTDPKKQRHAIRDVLLKNDQPCGEPDIDRVLQAGDHTTTVGLRQLHAVVSASPVAFDPDSERHHYIPVA